MLEKKFRKFLVSLFVVLLGNVLIGESVFAQLPVNIPRNETLILDQIFRYGLPNNFNLWNVNAATPTRQGLFSDTLWYIDQQTGKWINALAKEPPTYNKDYTEMTVKLRDGIYWSDGVKFTADDVVFTIQNIKKTPGMQWNAQFELYVDSVRKVDDFTVVVKLKKPYPRFHSLFTARYNACYIQPKHVFEKVEDPLKFTFYPPVSLGAYVLKDSDPAGYWELYERRKDWQRTSTGIITRKPGPRYVLTIFYGPNEKKVAAMIQHNLDVLMDLDVEAFQTLIKRNPYARSWYKDFPWAWRDEIDHRFFGFNLEKYPYNIKDVRWALALALDVVKLNADYIGGVTRVTPIAQPATAYHMKYFHKPLLPWLKDLKIEVTKNEFFKPFDISVPERLAKWAKDQGYPVTGKLDDLFGIGWWKYAPDVSEKLLTKHGFKRDKDGKWLLPDGTPWKISIIACPDEVDVFRLAIGAADQWKKFGIDVTIESLERDPYYVRQRMGDFVCTSSWGMADGGGASAIIDKWPFAYFLHSDYYVPTGQSASAGNSLRIKSKEVDDLLDKMSVLRPDDPKLLELGREWLKLFVENMWSIPTLSFKKFVTVDNYYWTNFPTAENPYGQPCYWFMGGRFILPYMRQTGRK